MRDPRTADLRDEIIEDTEMSSEDHQTMNDLLTSIEEGDTNGWTDEARDEDELDDGTFRTG